MSVGDEPTTRGDFPGGFPGDKRNTFSGADRTRTEENLFQFVRQLARLHGELEPLKHGELINLYVSDQQYVYARKTRSKAAVVVINNESKAVELEIDISPTGFADGVTLIDRLGVSRDAQISNGRLRVKLPERSASIFVRR
jgi:hypothetical protein